MAQANDQGKGASAQKRNIVLLGGIIVAVVAVAVVLVLTQRKSSGTDDTRTSPQRSTAARADRGTRRRPGRARRAAQRPAAGAQKPFKLQDAPAVPPETRKLYQAAEQYIRRYEQAATTNQGWHELSQWANHHGLFVEAYHCARLAGGFTTGAKWGIHNTRMLLPTEEEQGWELTTQQDFEANYAVKHRFSAGFNRRQLIEQLKQLKPGGGSANQSRIAALLLQIDCPEGRKLYADTIKLPGFYRILVRAIRQSYLGGIKAEQECWTGSWYQSPPMNLWLIQQLLSFSPKEPGKDAEKKSKQDARRTRGRGPGARRPGLGGPMGDPFDDDMFGPPGMRPGRRGKTAQISLSSLHKLLMLRVLARRGGVVSAKLMGDLLNSDKDGEIFKGIASGQIPPELFTRFTGIFAEPLVEAAATALDKHRSNGEEWSVLAEMMGRLLNDRIAHKVFASVESSAMPIDDAVAFPLAASGQGYILRNLLGLAGAGKLTGLNLPALFMLWTEGEGPETRSFWDWVGGFLPLIGPGKSELMPSGRRPGRRMRMPVGPPGMGPMDMDDEFGPGMFGPPGQRPGRLDRSPKRFRIPKSKILRRRRPSRGTGKGSDQLRWPVRRKFRNLVDADAAREFLMGLGKLGPGSAKALERPTGRRGPAGRPVGRPSTGGRGRSSVQRQGPQKLKYDAVRALASLYETRLNNYYRTLISDPDVGDLARLALCLIEDSGSCEKLKEQFSQAASKHPFGLDAADAGNDIKAKVLPGKVAVPVDTFGLADAGITAREALIYFDYSPAAEPFLSVLGQLITNTELFEEPERVVAGICEVIEAVGRWAPSDSTVPLADLIESTGDFGLRGYTRSSRAVRNAGQYATQVRRKALEVLGRIGDEESMNVILRLAMYEDQDPELLVSARVALAKRGYPGEALDLFIDILDPEKASQPMVSRNTRGSSQLISKLDPNLKDMTDVALLAVGRTKMTGYQISRILKVMRTLGQQRRRTSRGKGDLQELLVLKLLENADPGLLTGLAAAVRQPPLTGRGRSAVTDPFYWNRARGQTQDQAFLKMIQTLAQHESFEDEHAVAMFAKAIIAREEQNLLPGYDELSRWKLEDYLLTFGEGRRFASPRRMRLGPGPLMDDMDDMPTMPMGPGRSLRPAPFGMGQLPMPMGRLGRPRSRRPGRRDQAQPSGPQLDLSVKKLERLDKVPQDAALAAIELIKKLKGARSYLYGFNEFSFYKCHALLARLKLGDTDAAEGLISYFAAASSTPADDYAMVLALEQLEQQGGLELLKILGKSAQQSTGNRQLRLADAAIVTIKKLWEHQMAGTDKTLADKEAVAEISAEWKKLAQPETISRELADRIVVILSACQVDPEAVEVIDDLLRQFAGKSQPIAEQAVGLAVQILTGLNPSGNPALVGFYKTILTLTTKEQTDRDRPRRMLGQGQNWERASRFGVASGRQRQGRRQRRPRSGRRAATAATSFAYVEIGPMVISALQAMDSPESNRAVEQLGRTRQDLLGYIAIGKYQNDQTAGRQFMMQILTRSPKERILAVPARVILEFLGTQINPANLELMTAAVIKGSPEVADAALGVLDGLAKTGARTGATPAVDLTPTVKAVLKGLAAQATNFTKKRTAVDRAMKLAAQFTGDQEIAELLDQMEKIKARLQSRKSVSDRRPQRRTQPRRHR